MRTQSGSRPGWAARKSSGKDTKLASRLESGDSLTWTTNRRASSGEMHATRLLELVGLVDRGPSLARVPHTHTHIVRLFETSQSMVCYCKCCTVHRVSLFVFLFLIPMHVDACFCRRMSVSPTDPRCTTLKLSKKQKYTRGKNNAGFPACSYLALTSFVITSHLSTSLWATASPGPPHMSNTHPVIVTASSKAHTASDEVQYLSSRRRFKCVTGSGAALQVRLWHGDCFAFRAQRSLLRAHSCLWYASSRQPARLHRMSVSVPTTGTFKAGNLSAMPASSTNPRTIALVLGLVCLKPEASPPPRQALKQRFPVLSIGGKPVDI